MNVYEERAYNRTKLDQLYDDIDQSLRSVMQLAEAPDPAAHNINRARQLLREIDRKLLQLQETDHRLWWANEKVKLIEYSLSQSSGSDLLQ
jgi:hypothetical protein